MNYIISLVYGNHIYCSRLEENKTVSIGSSHKDSFILNDMKSSQITIKNKYASVFAESKKPFDFSLNGITDPGIYLIDKNTYSALYVDKEKDELSTHIELPHNAVITIGRNKNNDVTIANKFVSSRHCRIIRQDGVFYVEDSNSTNGTYLNRLKVSKAKFENGDEVHIFCYTIKLDGGVLKILNAGNDVTINSIPSNQLNAKGTDYKKGEKPVYKRSPRTQEELPKDDIVLAAPPTKGQKYERSRGMFSSVASSVAMVGSSMIMGGAVSAAMMAARASMLVMPATSIASQSSNNKRNKRRISSYEKLREARFLNYLNEQRARIYSVAQQQKKILTDENPSPADCYSIAENLNRNLWERTPNDRDYLDVRLGMGYEPLCVSVKNRSEAYGVELEDDEAKELSEMLVEETKYVDNIPVRVSLSQNNTIGVIGDRKKVVEQVKNMLAELTTMHCYTDVKIVGIFDEEEYNEWSDLRWLPHVWDDNKQIRYLAFDRDSSHSLCDGFNDMLKTRARDLKDKYGLKTSLPNPYYIFVLGSKKLMEHEEIMSNLLTNNPQMGVSTLFLFDDIYSLPNECDYIIDMQEYPTAYWRQKINSKFIFTQDQYDKVGFNNFARRLSSVELKGFAIQSEIPSSVTFLQGYGVKTVEELNIAERWKCNKAYQTLEAPIGVLAGDKTFSLNIRENKSSVNEHGPHGLVAGTTGSGKSELLQTWILSMCVNYHPYDVNFVIIDYKGGGMANLLEDMPHVVGKITNIGSNIKRSITSLERENKRRMAIFEQAGVNNIDKYQKLYHEGRVSQPLPHLVIVADEFAELKKEQPEFMSGLVSVARVGRTLGIHLVLATQKPTGVVDDQIDSNSRFRLCLKVQDVGDSREMIKTPDAAMITQAGRAYVKIGNFEYYEQFQSYWSGAPYLGAGVEKIESGNQVRIVAMNGERIKTVTDERTRFKSDVDELKAINNHICRVAEQIGISCLPGPWLPELPEEMYLEPLISNMGGFDGTQWKDNSLKWLQIPVGKYDIPELQEQGSLMIDFQKDGHYGIYGASGSGKTTFLKTMLTSIGRLYTPDDVNAYIIDCGGWSMSSFSSMPHVGDVILDVEEEKVKKFISLINDQINERKKLFHDNIVSSLSAYRQSVGKLPAILVMIDNIVPVFDLYPEIEDTLIRIAREGSTYGIYLIYTANSTSGIRFKVLQNIKGAVAFELTDRGDYPSIVGRMDGKQIPKVCGRAFYKDTCPVEFQTALYSTGYSDIERTTNSKQLSDLLSVCWKGNVPKRIPVMPDSISLSELKCSYKDRKSVPVGITYKTISTAYLQMESTYCALITGAINSGKSKTLCNIIETVKNDSNSLYLFDSEKESFSVYADFCEGYCRSDDPDGVSRVIKQIVTILNKRQTELNNLDISPAEYIRDKKMICVFIDDLNEFVNNAENEQRDMMNNIARLAKDLGVMLFAAGRLSDISKLSDIEPLTNTIVRYQNAIAIGGSPAMYMFLKNSLGFEEKNIECGQGNAWLFYNGACDKILISK